MISIQIFLVASLFMTLILAQTPKDFSPSSSTRLLLTFLNDDAVSPGQTLFKDTAEQKPKIGVRLLSSAVPFSSTGAYMIFMIDTTAQVLQWFELGLTASETSFDLDSTGTSTSDSGAPYLAPDPPAGSTHQYVLLLFTQPMGFVVPKDYAAVDPPRSLGARKGFDINRFISAVAQGGVTSLGEVVAATYFSVKAQDKEAEASVTRTVQSATAQHTIPALKSVASGPSPAASAQRTDTATSGASVETVKESLRGVATIVWLLILGQL